MFTLTSIFTVIHFRFLLNECMLLFVLVFNTIWAQAFFMYSSLNSYVILLVSHISFKFQFIFSISIK